jgi:hypothetical protein
MTRKIRNITNHRKKYKNRELFSRLINIDDGLSQHNDDGVYLRCRNFQNASTGLGIHRGNTDSGQNNTNIDNFSFACSGNICNLCL